MIYKTYFKIPLERKESINLGKALKMFNEENNVELHAQEYENSMYTIRVESSEFLIGYETHFIAFKFGQVYRDVVLGL